MVIKIRIKKLHAGAMAVWPFIFYRNSRLGVVTERHEKIHHRQQLEMLIIPFYMWYLVEYLVHFARLRNHDQAYRAISFEKEAYGNAHDKHYLKNREWCEWVKYL